MRIVHVIAYFSTNWKYQENYLALEQVKLGHEVHIITSERQFPHPDYEATAAKALGARIMQPGTEKVEGFTIHHLPIAWELSARVWLKGWIKYMVQLQPDLVICHGVTQPHTLQLLYQKKWNGRIIADEHILLSDLDGSKIKRCFLKLYGWLFQKQLTKRFYKIVAISKGVEHLLTNLMGFDKRKVEMIPLGTDTNVFYPNKQAGMAFRYQHNIAPDAKVVGYTGKINEYKKVHYLIDACRNYKTEKIHILLVGDVASEYQDFFSEKLASSTVKVTKLDAVPSSELMAVYNACDILAWPAHQTISTVNASACGKPVICSSFLKERYSAGQGIGIKSGNYEEFEKALFHLLDNEDLIKQMGEKGRRWALEEVSWASVNKRFIT